MNDEVTDINEAIKVINNLQVRTSDSGSRQLHDPHCFCFQGSKCALDLGDYNNKKRFMQISSGKHSVSIIVLKLLKRCVQILCQNKHQFLWKTCCHLRLQTDENVINKTEHVTSILSVKLSSTSPAHFLSQHNPHLDIDIKKQI